LKQIFKSYSKINRITYKNKFQFGYTENQDLLNGIAIWSLPCPILFILNTTSYEYSIVELIDPTNNSLLNIDIDKVIDKINHESINV
jgi:hypothetical protein